MSDKIPTAEEFLSDNINRTIFPYIDDELEDNSPICITLKACLIDFAKLHVKAALEAAYKSATIN